MTGDPASAPALRRVLGLTEVTAGGVGIIIGAGIYVLLGTATAQAGALVYRSPNIVVYKIDWNRAALAPPLGGTRRPDQLGLSPEEE